MMRRVLSVLVVLVAGAVGVQVAEGVAAQAQHPLVAEARVLFAEARLEMPAVLVRFDCDQEGWEDARGYFSGDRICVFNESLPTLMHELAHAWQYEHLSDQDRERFMEVTGLPTWGSHDHSWNQRATEKAADVMAWRLLDGSPNGVFESYWKALMGSSGG